MDLPPGRLGASPGRRLPVRAGGPSSLSRFGGTLLQTRRQMDAHLVPATGDDLENCRVRKRQRKVDDVVVTCGNVDMTVYHACPVFQASRQGDSDFPIGSIIRKSYRRPDKHAGQNVLLVGEGAPAIEIARKLSMHAKRMSKPTMSWSSTFTPFGLGDANGRFHYVYMFIREFHDADAATVNAETKVLETDAEDSSPFAREETEEG
ncbi:Thiol-specific monooxygenase [Penicillium cinerascens]|uniref:Thiol-specific monooxygenase n=1 Tax=Penicillium cinerascens TaxID=70096 RepID=A0A9W9MLM6_9EURO|nr:Thiol-specific monooxygenase [Penicillium cinerascens]KAJ5203626.1 Thiol-specific monooxygenase [Penicillium cinerascens]